MLSETSLRETWRLMFIDFLKFSITRRRPSSGMVPSWLNTPTVESYAASANSGLVFVQLTNT